MISEATVASALISWKTCSRGVSHHIRSPASLSPQYCEEVQPKSDRVERAVPQPSQAFRWLQPHLTSDHNCIRNSNREWTCCVLNVYNIKNCKKEFFFFGSTLYFESLHFRVVYYAVLDNWNRHFGIAAWHSLSFWKHSLKTAWKMVWRRQRLKIPRHVQRLSQEDKWIERLESRYTCEAYLTGCRDQITVWWKGEEDCENLSGFCPKRIGGR